MFLYNVHTPQKTFALTQKDGETRGKLFEKIWAKSGLNADQKESTSLVYEFEGERWSLDDDDDLEILVSRFPPSSTPSVTVHVQPPHAHAHFNSPPAYSTPSVSSPSSKIKSKSNLSSKQSKAGSTKSYATVTATSGNASSPKTKVNGNGTTKSKSNGNAKAEDEKKGQSALGLGTFPSSSAGQTQTQAQNENGVAKVSGSNLLAPPVFKTDSKPKPIANGDSAITGTTFRSVSAAKSISGQSQAKSMMSTRSRRSKWGDDDAEPLGLVKAREWHEFHNNNGVRTVMGKVNDVPNVRMLLKSGYKGVYVSRNFAIKHNIVPKKFGMGSMGYTGLKSIGNVDITVGTRKASHPAYMSEENHFDVILGRSWLERMAIKIDSLDSTSLTYMDSGEAIPCDIVVLKDEKGNVITIT
ncbi:hypothetical protein IAU59_001375 [Kwoniella sp. CBS 9459]